MEQSCRWMAWPRLATCGGRERRAAGSLSLEGPSVPESDGGVGDMVLSGKSEEGDMDLSGKSERGDGSVCGV